ncbi:hypothetical protein BKN38_01410 [Helicobacter sp. CLO-3]|uniref:hypothetical protein n=1 Tax=unclassified Helicobacter TaxID=2593540 RepID=UPI000804EAE2|nr:MULTISPECIES: hypothetical protein [unclassified Helicobacter]OBV29767.1 hypothetical protein BA723_00215 [Helicobacter sp. CLO-3]OHU85220.1 hypothetical protein BKN38_01410 [Helicobacter sp. CLO-3]
MQYFINTTKELGIQTRMIECLIQAEFSETSSASLESKLESAQNFTSESKLESNLDSAPESKQDFTSESSPASDANTANTTSDASTTTTATKFLHEYEMLGLIGDDAISQALQFSTKEKNPSIALILEILTQLYQKLARIEQHLLKEQQSLPPLENSGSIRALGHGVICFDNKYFTTNKLYYVRFCLPNASQRTMSVFAKAVAPEILHITRMHSHDSDALDSYIVSKEMEQLRQKRIRND